MKQQNEEESISFIEQTDQVHADEQEVVPVVDSVIIDEEEDMELSSDIVSALSEVIGTQKDYGDDIHPSILEIIESILTEGLTKEKRETINKSALISEFELRILSEECTTSLTTIKMQVEKDFIKADSANLPKVDSFMIANFFASNPDFCSAEFRNVKTTVSSRQSYGDNAIGYVQLKRDSTLCTVKCRICPVHKVRQTSYSVSMVIDEKEGVVKSVQCHDCPASLGGCKHSVAFLMWVHRRSEKPACTFTECYWKKSKLAKVGTTLKFTTATKSSEDSKNRNICSSQIIKHQPDYTMPEILQLSMHYLDINYKTENDTCDTFLSKIAPMFSKPNLDLVESQTRGQQKTPVWHEL
ncbi:hypothetical protein HW555_006459, partial [Spodoptera exigua]